LSNSKEFTKASDGQAPLEGEVVDGEDGCRASGAKNSSEEYRWRRVPVVAVENVRRPSERLDEFRDTSRKEKKTFDLEQLLFFCVCDVLIVDIPRAFVVGVVYEIHRNTASRESRFKKTDRMLDAVEADIKAFRAFSNLKSSLVDCAVKREDKPDVESLLSEDLWESGDGAVAGLLYGISEVGISKEIGRLAVFRCKEKPVMAYNLEWLKCWYSYNSAVQFGGNELLFVHRFRSGRGRFGMRLCILDLVAGRFTSIDSLTEDFYRVRYVGGAEYGFTKAAGAGPAETVIDLNTLSWSRLPCSWWDRLFL